MGSHPHTPFGGYQPGGAELDEYAKVFLLSMMAWHLYTDAVRRRREELNQGGFTNWTQIFFEEANKVLGRVNAASGDDEGGPRPHSSSRTCGATGAWFARAGQAP